jgi:hypothetical protein
LPPQIAEFTPRSGRSLPRSGNGRFTPWNTQVITKIGLVTDSRRRHGSARDLIVVSVRISFPCSLARGGPEMSILSPSLGGAAWSRGHTPPLDGVSRISVGRCPRPFSVRPSIVLRAALLAIALPLRTRASTVQAAAVGSPDIAVEVLGNFLKGGLWTVGTGPISAAELRRWACKVEHGRLRRARRPKRRAQSPVVAPPSNEKSLEWGNFWVDDDDDGAERGRRTSAAGAHPGCDGRTRNLDCFPGRWKAKSAERRSLAVGMAHGRRASTCLMPARRRPVSRFAIAHPPVSETKKG